MEQHVDGEMWKMMINSRMMAEKYESFAKRNPGNVLSQSNVQVMMEVSKQLFKAADLEAETSRYEEAMLGMLSGDVGATTHIDLDPMEESLTASLFENFLGMTEILAGLDLENMVSASVLTAMRIEGLTGFESGMVSFAKGLGQVVKDELQRSGDNAEEAGYSKSASYQRQMSSLLWNNLENLEAGYAQSRVELDIEQARKRTGSSTPYRYRRLDGGRKIRLLSIDHVTGAAIKCRLSEMDLDALNVKYSALSYVWGDYRAPALSEYNPNRAKQEFVINCDGLEILVTLNLYQFLEQESQQIDVAKKEYYWIDQVCINQQDQNEKATQVSMMDEIYKSAERVIAWLGPEDPFTAGAVRTIQYIASVVTDLEDGERDRAMSKLKEEGPIDLQMWDALGAILDRAYFSRAWILQEMILAPRLQFYCGSYEISGGELEKCAMIITQAEPVRRYLDAYGKTFSASTQTADYTKFGQQIAMICEVRKNYINEPVENLFFLGRCFNATNAHDHGYALLGLIKERLNHNDGNSDFQLPAPDYGKLVKKTYLDFRTAFLNATGDLRLLSHIEDSSCRSINSLPSWIPDLSVRLWPQPFCSASIPSRVWCAPGSLPFKRFPVHEGILTIHAACIDTVKEAAIPFGNPRVWVDVFQVMNVLRDSGCSTTYPDEALVRTLVADSHRAVDSTSEHKSLANDFRYWLIDELAQLGEDTGYLGINYDETELAREHVARSASKIANYLENMRNNKVAAVRAFNQDLPSMITWLQGFSARTKRYDVVKAEAEKVHADLRTILSQTKGRSNVLPTERELGELLEIHKGPDSAEKAILTEAADRFRSKVGSKTKFRRVMRTANGWLGMGPSSLRAGDRVFVAPGANTPLIMRRLDPGHYQVVGEAYIHGIMHGEAVSENVKTMEIHLGNDTDFRFDAISLPRNRDKAGAESAV